MTVRVDDILTIEDGRLRVEDCDVATLAERHGTPLFVLSESRIRDNCRAFLAALRANWPGDVQLLPSIKANYLLAVRRILTQEGAGCDTFGPGELWVARQSGVPPELVSVNGSVKSPELIRSAIEYGARITLDSASEAQTVRAQARALGRRAIVRIRVRPDYSALEGTSDFDDELSIGELASRYKPGVPWQDLLALGRELLAAEEVDLIGLMAHIGRHRGDLGFWEQAVECMVDTMGRAAREWDWQPREIDVGGGYATNRDPTARALPQHAGRPIAPTIDQYVEVVAATASRVLRRGGFDPAAITLELEPGRSLFADAGIHLTRIRNVKQDAERTWVETDTTEMFLTDGVLEHNRFVPMIVGGADRPPADSPVDVVGMSCQFDIIVPDAQLPTAVAGDVLALLDTGAYLEGSATNFNALPRPATILVNGSDADLIKRAETIEEIFARDMIPARLLQTGPPANA